MLATPEGGSSAYAATKPGPQQLGLIEYRRLVELLAVTRPTLDKMAKDEMFPKRIRLGRVFYIRVADLQRWVDAR